MQGNLKRNIGVLVHDSSFPNGCFLKWWYPKTHQNWSFSVGKPIVVGYHHFRKPPHGDYSVLLKTPRMVVRVMCLRAYLKAVHLPKLHECQREALRQRQCGDSDVCLMIDFNSHSMHVWYIYLHLP